MELMAYISPALLPTLQELASLHASGVVAYWFGRGAASCAALTVGLPPAELRALLPSLRRRP